MLQNASRCGTASDTELDPEEIESLGEGEGRSRLPAPAQVTQETSRSESAIQNWLADLLIATADFSFVTSRWFSSDMKPGKDRNLYHVQDRAKGNSGAKLGGNNRNG